MTFGVFGAARDGSTLLMRLLDGSPDLWIYPIEIKFFCQIAAQRDLRAWRREPQRIDEALVPVDTLSRYALHQLDQLRQGYLAKLADGAPHTEPVELPAPGAELSWGEALEWFLAAARRSLGEAGTRRLGFKTTEALEKLLYERALGARLRAVHIVRDPIEQFASTKRTVLERPEFLYWYQGRNAKRVLPLFVERWSEHARTALAAAERDPSTALIVRYEDIRADAPAQVHRICAWLGVEPPPLPEIQTVLDGRHMSQLPANPSKAGVATPARVVADTAAEFGYEDVVEPRERDVVLSKTGSLARAFGYDLPVPSRTGRLRTLIGA
jgi:hypothetical protein